MKIIHSSGKELETPPGTALEMSRTNPFFNQYGEQSLPVKLPGSDHNRLILGFPDDLAAASKTPQRNDATICEGVFSIRCRQAILSAGDGEIDTSYYLNTGSFYEKIKDLKLATLFKDKVINFSTVGQAVQFVRSLFVSPDPRFACFPIVVEHQDTGQVVELNKALPPARSDGYYYLYNEAETTEKVGENTIRVPAGFYITPFIKAMHLLEEMFSLLDYQTEASFFSRTSPFPDMVFLNANIDTIVNGQIRYDQIIPDCTVSALLDIFRNKFCCEFIPDEPRKKIRIELFNEALDDSPASDLTRFMTKKPVINHAAKYKQLKLSADKGQMLIYQTDSDGVTGVVAATPDYLSKTLPEIASQYPDAVIDRTLGSIYREGFSADRHVRDVVGSINCDYMAVEDKELEVEKKESPDTLVHIFISASLAAIQAPFAGLSRSLNSQIVLDNEPRASGDSVETGQKKTELKPMLCFTAHVSGMKYDVGTVYAHIIPNRRIWDYTLCYNGPDGLYEKFWRRYDLMLRNAFRPVTTEMLLPDTVRINLPAHKKVLINNQEVLPNIIKYYLGKSGPTECTFLTTKPLFPVSVATPESDHFPDSQYYWAVKTQRSDNGANSLMWLKEIPETFYLPPPTRQQYLSGGQYYRRTYPCYYAPGLWQGKVSGTITVWLQAAVRPYNCPLSLV